MKWPRRKPAAATSAVTQELLAEIAGHRAQIDTLFDQIRLAKAQRDRAIVKANELMHDIDGNHHKYWHPDKEGPYYQIQR